MYPIHTLPNFCSFSPVKQVWSQKVERFWRYLRHKARMHRWALTSNPRFPRHQMVSSAGGMSITDTMSPTCNTAHTFTPPSLQAGHSDSTQYTHFYTNIIRTHTHLQTSACTHTYIHNYSISLSLSLSHC